MINYWKQLLLVYYHLFWENIPECPSLERSLFLILEVLEKEGTTQLRCDTGQICWHCHTKYFRLVFWPPLMFISWGGVWRGREGKRSLDERRDVSTGWKKGRSFELWASLQAGLWRRLESSVCLHAGREHRAWFLACRAGGAEGYHLPWKVYFFHLGAPLCFI